MRLILSLAAVILGLHGLSPAHADTRDAFAARVTQAYAAKNKTAALKTLFYLKGVDPQTLDMYEKRIIGRMLGKYDRPSVAFEPLPKDFNPVQVAGGYEYRPNIPLKGYLVLNAKTRVPYGQKNGRYYITAMTRRAVKPGGPPDKTLQMMLIGTGHPPVRYEGHCDVMQSNGKARRMRFEDAGRGNNTMIITARHIVRCDVRNLSGRGSLSLRLLEGQNTIFAKRVEAPQTAIAYRR